MALVGLMGLAGLFAGWLLTRPPPEPEPSITRLAAPPSAESAPPITPPPRAEPPPIAAASPAPVRAAPAADRRDRIRPQAHPSGLMARCSRLPAGERAWCGHRVVMSQDRALRRAYSRAVRAGVSRQVLAQVSDRWGQLRHDARRQPGRVAAGYAAMARDLDRRAAARSRR